MGSDFCVSCWLPSTNPLWSLTDVTRSKRTTCSTKGKSGCGHTLGNHCDNLINSENSQTSGTSVTFLTIGDTRLLEQTFTEDGKNPSSPSVKRIVELKNNSLSELPSSDETLHVRGGGDSCPYGPELPTLGMIFFLCCIHWLYTWYLIFFSFFFLFLSFFSLFFSSKIGCWLHGVPCPVGPSEISMGYGFRDVQDICQVDMTTHCVRWDCTTWARYSSTNIKYKFSKKRNKRDYHKEVNAEWANVSQEWSNSVRAKVLDAVGKWG